MIQKHILAAKINDKELTLSVPVNGYNSVIEGVEDDVYKVLRKAMIDIDVILELKQIEGLK